MTKIDRPDVEDRYETIDDEKKRVLDLHTVRLLPPEGVGIFDEPTRCYRINLQWAKIVMGMVSWLAELPIWAEAQNEGYEAINEILKFLEGDNCDIMPFQLRQNPANACILQQSLDGGETWINAFDFSLCESLVDKSYQVQIQNQVTYVQPTFQEIYNYYTTNYAGTPESVHPDLDDPTGDSAALRAALCNALYELVRTACDSAVSYYRDTVESTQNEINVGLGIAAFLLTAIALAGAIPSGGASLAGLAPAAGLWAAGIGLGGVLGNALVDFWQSHTVEQFQDTEAQEAVACFLFDTLQGTNVSLEALRDATDGTIGTANGQAILDFLNILMQNDSTYAAFLEKWANNKEYADAGIELYCPCMSGFVSWEWDFTTMGQGDFYLDNADGTADEGVFVAGQGWKATNILPGGQRCEIAMLVNPAWKIRSVAFHTVSSAAPITARSFVLRPTAHSTAGQSAQGLAAGVDYAHCGNDHPAASGFNEISPAIQVSVQTSDVYITKVAIVFEADAAKIDAASHYTPDVVNLCD